MSRPPNLRSYVLFNGAVGVVVVLLCVYPLLLLTNVSSCDAVGGMSFAAFFERNLAPIDVLPSVEGYLQKMRAADVHDVCILKEVYAFDTLAMLGAVALAVLVMMLSVAQPTALRPLARRFGGWFVSSMPDGMRGVRRLFYFLPLAFALLFFWWLDMSRSSFKVFAGRVHLNEYFVLNDTVLAGTFISIVIVASLLYHHDKDADAELR